MHKVRRAHLDDPRDTADWMTASAPSTAGGASLTPETILGGLPFAVLLFAKGGSALRFSFPAPPVSDSCFPTRHPNLSNPRPFNVLPSRSNDTKKVIDTHCTFVLFFLVFTCTKLRSAGSYPRCFEHPTKDAHPESANGGGAEGFFSATRPPQFLTRAPVPLSHRFPCPITLLPCTPNRCRINTCKSLSKQTALTLIESHSYKKHRGEGVLWLTSHGI